MAGFDKVADAVVGTLGPRGRNVFIDDAMAPKITNDGATISQYIILPDKVENMGANIVRNTSAQTNDDAGDGTTTTAVLLQAIVHQCINRPENPMEIEGSLKESAEKIIKLLKKQAVEIDPKDVDRVAMISADGSSTAENKQIAQIVTAIIGKIGEDAVITVEDSRTSETEYEIVEGYEAGVGFMNQVFVNDPKRARAVMNNVPVLVTEKKIASIGDLANIFGQFKQEGITEAVIVCEDIEAPILGVLAGNKMSGNFSSVVIRATGDTLKDIEAVVGAKRISDSNGISFLTFDVKKHLGKVKKIVSDSNKTLFIPHNTSSATQHANFLQKFADAEPNMYIKERLNKRISQLRGGVAVIKVGAHTDFEREFLKLKAEDTIKAVKAALEEGIVEGGGMALWRIAQSLKPKTIGDDILKKALTAPLRKIIENAGKDYAEIISNMPKEMGYDAKKGVYVEMIKEGIIDPAKVERCALQNSVSAAAKFITVFCTISDVEPKESK